MVDAIVLERHGGPAELRLASVEVGAPGPGELRVEQTAIGVNYHDVYARSGLYRTLPLPGIPGIEAVGRIVAVGDGVEGFVPGERIGYVSGGYGAYAASRILPAAQAIRLPDEIADAPAAASLMKALTVCVLVRRVHVVRAGDAVLVHAAAGGVGQLLCSWARRLGATVIGTVGDPGKAESARCAGAHHVVLYREEDVPARVAAITDGAGVAAAYDSIGEDTFLDSVRCLGFEGKLINFGQSSGPVSPFPPSLLAARSLSVARPIVFHYLRTTEMARMLAAETFAAFRDGSITPIEPLVLPLVEAAEAHRILEARQSPGGIVLVP